MNKAQYVFNKLAQLGKAPYNPNKNRTPWYNVDSIQKFNTSAGPRFYSGHGYGANKDSTIMMARQNAKLKSINSPADSMTTKQINEFKK